MFIDTHCHLSVEDYDDIDTVIKENRAAGISKIIISGCSYDSIIESLDIADKYEDVYVTIGYHPDQVEVITEKELLFLKDKLSHPKVVGIGEIGLDYHYSKELKEAQIILFEKQLKLAEEYNLPVVIHSRDATNDTINCLKKFNLKGDIHCFSGSLETAKIYISMGYYLGIGGVVTFKNSNLGNVIKEIGLSNVLLETDSPYLSPVPYRGMKNSSKNIPIIAEYIANLLDISNEEVSKITLNNTSQLFDL
ncbi:MAG: TatD family hydrolase [Bacilli bacterium]|nr:TatD family hydrolase [Bacilli bacterium]